MILLFKLSVPDVEDLPFSTIIVSLTLALILTLTLTLITLTPTLTCRGDLFGWP